MLEKRRNIGIIAHIDAGKTTTTERILLYTGIITKTGEVHEGSATMDWMEAEKKRGITIGSAATECPWKNYIINIIDTPGHVDFTIEVERSLRVLDGAVCILDGGKGVQTQTRTVWKQANHYKVPRIIFINKLDNVNANLPFVLETVKNRLKAIDGTDVTYLLLHIPVGRESTFSGVIDIISMKYLYWASSKEDNYIEKDIPQTMEEHSKKVRSQMFETLINFETNEDIISRYFDGKEPYTNEEIKHKIRELTVACKIFPVLCGAAYKNIGIQPLLDAVLEYLPSPNDIPIINGYYTNGNIVPLRTGEEGKLMALVFKIMTDPFGSKLYFVRVYSGALKQKDTIFIPRLNKVLKIGSLFKMHANNRTQIADIKGGDIGAMMLPPNTGLITGDTITILESKDEENVILESIEIPERVISMVITPATKSDMEKLSVALRITAEEDPSFQYVSDENGIITISGMGKLHLEIITDNWRKTINFTLSSPYVKYLECITSELNLCYEHKKQTGGRGQYAVVYLKFKPIDPNEENNVVFLNKIVGGVIPTKYIPYVEKGIRSAAMEGPIKKSPVIGFEVSLYDGKSHDVDSSQLAFEICGNAAMREAMQQLNTQGGIKLMEPMMLVTIEDVEPQDYGAVTGLINSKNGLLTDSEDAEITAVMPLAKTFNLITELRECTQGRSSFSMKFFNYSFCSIA